MDFSSKSADREKGARTGFLALVIFALALIVRVGYLLQIQRTPLTDLLLIDAETYHRFAAMILGGTFRGEEVYSMNLLYPYFLAGIYAIAGMKPVAALGAQALLGAATVSIVAAVSARAWGNAVGWVAGVIAALYAPSVFYSGALLTPVVIQFTLALTMFFTLRSLDSPSRANLILTGLSLALAALGRGNAVLYLVFLPVLFAWRFGLRGARHAILPGLVVVLALGGVTLRNYLVEGELVPVSANYAAFYIGHHEQANGLYTLPPFLASASFESEVWGTRDAVAEQLGRSVTLGESARYLFDEGVRYARENPRQDLALLGRKFFYFWNRTESPTNLNYYFASDFAGILRLLPFHMGVIAPLALAGLFLTPLRARNGPFLAMGLVPLITCLLFFVSAEYRLPVALFTIPFAAVALVITGSFVRRAIANSQPGGDEHPQAAPGARVRMTVAFLVLVSFGWFANRTDTLLEAQTWKRVDYLNFGTLYLDRGDLDQAEEMFQQSLAIDPQFAPAYESLSEVARRHGNDQEAARLITRAREFGAAGQYDRGRVQYDDVTEAMIAVAAIYNEGRFEDALVEFQNLRTWAMGAQRADLLSTISNNVGLCLYKMARYANAEDEFRTIMDHDPYYKKAHYNLGRVFEATGRPEEAIAAYRAAMKLDPGYTMAETALRRLLGESAAK